MLKTQGDIDSEDMQCISLGHNQIKHIRYAYEDLNKIINKGFNRDFEPIEREYCTKSPFMEHLLILILKSNKFFNKYSKAEICKVIYQTTK